MKRLLILCLVLLVAAEAFAGKQLVNLPLNSDLNDTKGNLTAGQIVRNSDATYVGTDGTLKYSRGTRTNLLTYSNDFTQSYFSPRVGVPASYAAIAIGYEDPFGGLNGAKLTENDNTLSVSHSLHHTPITASGNTTYVASFYAKAVERSAVRIWFIGAAGGRRVQAGYNLSNGTLYSAGQAVSPWSFVFASMTPVGNGWYRCFIAGTTGAGETSAKIQLSLDNDTNSNADTDYVGTIGYGILVYGLQIEQLPSGNVIGPDTVTNGGFDSDTAWTKGTDWAISGGVATKTSGTASDLSQATTYPSGETVQVVFTLTRTAGTLTPKIGSVSSTAFSSSGTYTVYIKTAASSASLIFSADSSFAGTIDNVTARAVPDLALLQPGPYTQTAGSTATIPAQPRFEANGLLIEGEATNRYEYSSDYTGRVISTAETDLVSAAILDPFGSGYAMKVVAKAVAGSGKGVQETPILPNTGTTITFFAKAAEYSRVGVRENTYTGAYAVFLLSGAGSVISNATTTATYISRLSDGWYRCGMSFNATAGANIFRIFVLNNAYTSGSPHSYSYTGDGTSGLYLWGVQVESTPFPTSYIPTNGCPVTRLSEAGNNSPENGYRWTMSQSLKNILGAATPSRGTLLVDITPAHSASGGVGAAAGRISVTNSASSLFYYNYTNSRFESTDGTNTPNYSLSISSGTTYTKAIRWDRTANGGAGYLQIAYKAGGTWYTSTSGSQRTAYDGSFTIGDYLRLSFGNEYPIWIKNIRIYDGWVKNENLDNPERAGMFPILPTFKKIKPYLY